LFLPFVTDEIEYDEVYVNLNVELLKKKKEVELKDSKVKINEDVDFLSNLAHT